MAPVGSLCVAVYVAGVVVVASGEGGGGSGGPLVAASERKRWHTTVGFGLASFRLVTLLVGQREPPSSHLTQKHGFTCSSEWLAELFLVCGGGGGGFGWLSERASSLAIKRTLQSKTQAPTIKALAAFWAPQCAAQNTEEKLNGFQWDCWLDTFVGEFCTQIGPASAGRASGMRSQMKPNNGAQRAEESTQKALVACTRQKERERNAH